MMSSDDVKVEVVGGWGLITLTRPKALNALSLPMVQALLATLLAWRQNPAVRAVAIRGTNRVGQPGTPSSFFGGLCAGGDIRFFHQAALAGDADLETFFTTEYTLNHLIHTYPKPYVAFMDGIVMGGGMGISQGASLRIVTEKTRMAMPETGIGLFPDVGGGYFLSRCPGSTGEYLALSGETIDGAQAVKCGLADVCVPSDALHQIWGALQACSTNEDVRHWIATNVIAPPAHDVSVSADFDVEILAAFGHSTVPSIVAALEAIGSPAALSVTATLRQRSPLMLHVVLEQIRRARVMSLTDDLRMERDMVQHCFYTKHLGRYGSTSETVEGIRALAVDKDFKPQWNPARIEDVTDEMVSPFFVSPWSALEHPLRELA